MFEKKYRFAAGFTVLWAAWAASGSALGAESGDKVDFARDVRTILADHCLACHGPDEGTLKAGLRLDLRESAIGPRKSGKAAIVPGDAAGSELVHRVFSTDPDEQMPPPETKKPLTDEEKATLKKWVEQGAEYELHWSFIAPEPTALPKVKGREWGENEIDRFVLSRLEANGLKPSPRADKHTLIRRLYLDLLGLPPTPDEVDGFIADAAPDAWERLVDRVLNSPRFGEKIGLMWLDLARFGDTNGYHYDSTREMWLWRDYVIAAYNHDKPYDRFTLEQLAGDMLEKPTPEQLIASGFNRNTRFNEEGGADPEEFAVTYAKDRVFTLGQVWLGLTTGCAECHSHKYDPISHKEYYQLYAFFNSIEEPMASGNHGQKLKPLLTVPSPEQEKDLADAKARLAETEARITEALTHVSYAEPAASDAPADPAPVDVAWIDDDAPPGVKLQGDGQSPGAAWQFVEPRGGRYQVFKGKKSMRRSGTGLNQHFFTDAKEPLTVHAGDKLFAYVWLDPLNTPKMVQLQFHSVASGWAHRAYWGEDRGHGAGQAGPANLRIGDLPPAGQWTRLEVDAAAVGLGDGAAINGWSFTQFDGTVYYDYAGIRTAHPSKNGEQYKSLKAWEKVAAVDNNVPQPVRDAIKVAADQRTVVHQKLILNHYVRFVYQGTREAFDPLNKEAEALNQRIAQLNNAIPTTMVSKELDTPRDAFLLVRGDFLQKGEKVDRGVPAVFPPMDKDLPRNRLGLAKWLADPDHPLTSRVAVNRHWYQMFGTGLVKTLGDFGLQGELPSHPDLLDWLATEFIREGWSNKAILRKIALSATYQQSSSFEGGVAEQDPYNRLLYRAPRFRISAEEVRDTSLAMAGVLSGKIGGPSVMPYQPADFYVGKMESWPWKIEEGENLYRRGMYTFWRRTALHPMFAIFDAPSREVCTVERSRTNTPLQALATLNGPAFVEAARVLAQELLQSGPGDEPARIERLFRHVMVRKPTTDEAKLIGEIYRHQLDTFKADPSGAAQFVQTGQYRRPEGLDPVEHAAWTAVANALMNTDEAITRE